MKVCTPITRQDGLNDVVARHFGMTCTGHRGG